MKDNCSLHLDLFSFQQRIKRGEEWIGGVSTFTILAYTRHLLVYRKTWAITLVLHENVCFTETIWRAYDGPRGWYSICTYIDIDNVCTSSIYLRCTNCPVRIDLKRTWFPPAVGLRSTKKGRSCSTVFASFTRNLQKHIPLSILVTRGFIFSVLM